MENSNSFVKFDTKEYNRLLKSLDESVAVLTKKFRSACYKYRDNNSNVATHRLRDSALNVINDEKSDLTLLEAQEQFAWLMHEIQTGPVLFAKDHIFTANDLIKSLSSE
jgi:hypothetical protein